MINKTNSQYKVTILKFGRVFCLFLRTIELSIVFETERWVNLLVPDVLVLPYLLSGGYDK